MIKKWEKNSVRFYKTIENGVLGLVAASCAKRWYSQNQAKEGKKKKAVHKRIKPKISGHQPTKKQYGYSGYSSFFLINIIKHTVNNYSVAYIKSVDWWL